MSKTKTNRNLEIYKEYIESDTSYNKLANKYKLTPQRISAIVNDMKELKLEDSLDKNSSKDQRDKKLNQALSLRERGNLEIAENLFKQALKWDLENNKPKDAVDIYGHLRICYSRLAQQQSDIKAKVEFYEMAKQQLVLAQNLINDYPKELDEGMRAIMNVHFATIILETVSELKLENPKAQLEEALENINKGIEALPGSRAHKAWPKRVKGEILFNLGLREEAISTLLDAEKDLYLGYKEETKDKNNEFKIGVWLAGIHLTIAKMALDMGRKIIAKHYATSVKLIDDPKGLLEERKKEARLILKEVEKIEIKEEQ